MRAKSKAARATSSKSKKKPSKGATRSGSLQSIRGASSVKRPANVEEVTLLAWEKTYENRNKRFKI